MKFPAVAVDQVLGLLKVVHNLGGRVDAMHVNDAVDADLGDLSHVIDAAEMLGLLRSSGGDLLLTESGKAAVEKPLRELQRYLRDVLQRVEPFTALVRRVAEAKRVSMEEVEELLRKYGYDERGVRRILNWAVFAQLVEIDDGQWVVPS
ncbi:AAA-associated domain-containing protein [Pyrobaculum neutrophilum]|uniref:ABC nitrate/sulfonate/bicarbonate family transporter, ATPase subunit n=1 Tax=Pyrobaculum neutrophilum (strain DSM 2338 / JCM 9278 / NBRC 100436 / V24Sta) TaxID=444157 RepID=B1YAR8_PYRNV|nr:AAA-associated domain-containing protein [Pyrobaculum neutrophilum]ACB39147.1 conserved hypothetical protein [Pyrobaculum neutrophilum V24Sta]